MEHCAICNQRKDEPGDLTATYVITEQQQTKSIRICRTCIDYLCDDTTIGEWFPLQSTDEMIKLPDGFYMRL
jgi:hypothetical protein